jgi:hypothetical protein
VRIGRQNGLHWVKLQLTRGVLARREALFGAASNATSRYVRIVIVLRDIIEMHEI